MSTREGLRIRSSPCERPPGWPAPHAPPTTLSDWEALRARTKAELLGLGLGSLDGRLMLFPGEWHSQIPAGFVVETIGGESEAWSPGESDTDIRFGCLAYGIPAIDGVREAR